MGFKRFSSGNTDYYRNDYVGQQGELTWDDYNGLRLHDGSTSGGNAIGGSSANNILTVNGINGDWHNPGPQTYSVSTNDVFVYVNQNGTTDPVTVELPSGATNGQVFYLKWHGDGVNSWTVQMTGGGSINSVSTPLTTTSVDAYLNVIWDNGNNSYWVIGSGGF